LKRTGKKKWTHEVQQLKNCWEGENATNQHKKEKKNDPMKVAMSHEKRCGETKKRSITKKRRGRKKKRIKKGFGGKGPGTSAPSTKGEGLAVVQKCILKPRD